MNKKVVIRLKPIVFSLVILCAFAVPIAAQKTNSKMLVSTSWLAKNINKTVVLHVGKDRKRYDTGHIQNARFVAWNEITTTRNGVPNELPPIEKLQKVFNEIGVGNAKRIIIYGDNSGLFAARAFFTLDYLGHGNRVALLNGGLEKWTAEGRKTSTKTVKSKSVRFTPNPRVKKVTFLDTVKDVSWSVKNINASKVALVDARPNLQYTGEVPGKGVTRGGHIPGAKNLFWMNNIVNKENPVMKPKSELRKLYQSSGIRRNKTVVVYCRSGGQASHAYFTLRYLGYDVVMYDGSFFEWSGNPSTQIAKGKTP